MPEPEQLLRPSEASRLLGTNPDTLARWADRGRIPCTRTPGGHRRYDPADVEALRTTAPPTQAQEPGIPALLLAAANALNAAADALTRTTEETR